MVAFLAALPAFIQAIPYLLELAVRFMALSQKIIGWAEKNNLRKWIEDVEENIDLLTEAKTPDEKRDAARRLSDVIKSLG